MFHNFNIVLGCLDLYDKKEELSLTIDFKDKGLYYEPSQGSNWWGYYFDQVTYPSKVGLEKKGVMKLLKDSEKAEFGNGVHFFMTRERAHELISKYIVIKKNLLEEINIFYERHLKNSFVIGVHYRGTDKWLESNYVGYEEFFKVIDQELAQHENIKIYVATDEQKFLDEMKRCYGDLVIYSFSERREDGKPLHYISQHPYEHGKEALIDCLLLAKSSILIRTNSNLSAVSAFFNPNMDVINLNQVNDFLYQGLSKKGVLNTLNLKSQY